MRRALAAALTATALLALPAGAQASSQTLTVSKAGSGSGTLESFPSAIKCGATCSAPFAEGSEVTIYAFPDANSAAAKWTGCDSVDSEGRCHVAMGSERSVTATFALLNRTLSVSKSGQGTVSSSPGGIGCGSSCSAEYPSGTEVILTGSPASGYEAPTWTGCGSVDAEDHCHVTMGVSKSVSASFDSTTRTLSVTKTGEAAPFSSVSSTTPGISCGSVCSAAFAKNSQVTLTAATAPQGKAVVWSGCTPVSGHPNECKVTLSEAKSVSAKFELQPSFSLVTLSVTKSGTGSGTISGTGGISCGSACSAQLISSTQATLTATPSPGSVFTRWSGGGCTGAGPCTTTVKASKTVTAVFTLSGQRTLTVTKAGTGQGTVTAKAAGIECGSACSSQVPAAKKITLSAKAATGSTFARWSGACQGTAKTCKVTMSEARSVTAVFASNAGPAASPAAKCVVPRLAGKSLKAARSALSRANCSLGKVKKPKRGRRLVVRSSSPGAGASLAAGAKVGLKLTQAKKSR